jgi:signal transduction histidine kinase
MAEKLRQEGFTLSVPPFDVPAFPYDREVMVQLLINLIENSIKFGRQSKIRRITVSLEATDTQVAIRVADTGPGIPRQALKKVFDDFYRVEDPLTHTTGGTGIGLSLVKKFATAMDGKVTAANNDGPGCTITIHLPRG